MQFTSKNFDSWCEADVREELLAPVLTHLGYQKGTENNILRELSLMYPRTAFGIRKPTDPPLRSAPDYICEVGFPSGRKVRWVLEAKSPSEALDAKAVEQAYTYANHQEVCAVYFCLSNGREFRIYQTSSGTTSPPLFAATYSQLAENITVLENILSPSAIQRDWKDHTLDPGKPIGPGLRSVAQIVGGHIEYGESKPALIGIRGLTVAIIKGAIARGPNGHLEGYFFTRSPYGQIQRTLEKLGLGEFPATSPDTVLSTDPQRPSTFASTQRFAYPAGEILYNFVTGQDVELPTTIVVDVTTSATGHLEGCAIRGSFVCSMQFGEGKTPPHELQGRFEVLLA
jgi:hypothetical protein